MSVKDSSMWAVGKDRRIQALRGLAAMLVVVLHARATVHSMGLPFFVVGSLIPDPGFGAFGVDLFFVVSGVVMGIALKRNTAPRVFFRARFVRVVPLFWLAAIMTITINLALSRPLAIESLTNSVTIFPLFDVGVIDPPLPAVGWTLGFELYFYVIVGLALYLPSRLRFEAVVGTLLIGALVGELIQPVLLPAVGVTCNAMLLEFAFGLFALRAASHVTVVRFAPVIIGVGIIALLYSVLIGFGFSSAPEAAVAGQTSVARMLAWGLPSALLVAGLIARPDRLPTNSPWVRLGNASYSIYLIHLPIMIALPLVWPLTGPVGNDLLFLTLVASGAFGGLIAHYCVERPLLARLQPKEQRFATQAVGLQKIEEITAAISPAPG